MKALVLEEYKRFAYRDVPEPELGPRDVMIRVKACGICGSDIHGMDGSTGRRQPPIIMGHEAAGVIAETGREVKTWKVGDRVTFDSTIYCGVCHYCRQGRPNLCDHRRIAGVSCDEYRLNGAMAEYFAVPEHILYGLPEGFSFAKAAMAEPLSVALHAVHRTPIRFNDSAMVVGAGVIGLLVIQALRAAGCGMIIAVDLNPRRLELAQKLGADLGLNPQEGDLRDEILRRTENRGVQLAFEVVGIAPAFKAATQGLRKGGLLTLVGNLSPNVEMALQRMVIQEITLIGSCASSGEYPAALEMMSRGLIQVDPLISAAAPLAEGARWFDRLHRGDPDLVKVILEP